MSIIVKPIDGNKLKLLCIDAVDTYVAPYDQKAEAMEMLSAAIDLLKGNVDSEKIETLTEFLNNL